MRPIYLAFNYTVFNRKELEMDRLYLALAALGGGILMALLGWADSQGEPFDWRKFLASVIRSLIPAIGFAAGYELGGTITIVDIFVAFLAGAGFDTAVNRIASWQGWPTFPIPEGD
jgi:hypothetical protein